MVSDFSVLKTELKSAVSDGGWLLAVASSGSAGVSEGAYWNSKERIF
jgi:hypothetical protein